MKENDSHPQQLGHARIGLRPSVAPRGPLDKDISDQRTQKRESQNASHIDPRCSKRTAEGLAGLRSGGILQRMKKKKTQKQMEKTNAYIDSLLCDTKMFIIKL